MKKLLVCLAAVSALGAGATPIALDWKGPEKAPAKVARPFGGFLPDGRFVVAGGSDFKAGLVKVYTRDVFVRSAASTTDASVPTWTKVGELPHDVAEGVVCETPFGLFCAGGTDGKETFRDAFLLKVENGKAVVEKFPDLPEPLAMGAAAADGTKVYVVGAGVWTMDLAKPGAQWSHLPSLLPHGENALQQMVAAVQNGDQKEKMLVVAGGYDAKTKEPSRYVMGLFLSSVGEKSATWKNLSPLPEKTTTIGAAFLPSGNQHILLVGGYGFDSWNEAQERAKKVADGTFKERAQALVDTVKDEAKRLSDDEWKPVWQRKILAYNCVTDAWCEYGEIAADDVPRCGAAAGLRPGKTPEQYELVLAGGEEAPRVRTDRVTVGSFRKIAKFSATAWTVVAGYALLMVGMAVYFIRKQMKAKDANAYFRGGNIPWYVAGMSIFATMLSSITFIAIPTQAYLQDWRYFVMAFFIIGMAPVAIYYYLPFFCRLGITSAYEYLEKRFNLGVRLFGSAAFVVFMVCRVAVVTLLPAIALNAVTGVSIDACILICGVLTMVYCSLGGLEAVIWSDFVQGLVLMGGAVSVLVILVLKTGPEGAHVATFLDIASSHGKTTMLDFRFLLSQPVFWVVAVQGLVSNLSSYTSDQCVIQRYIATPDEQATKRSLWFNGGMSVFAQVVFYGIGTALFAHYHAHPEMMDVTMPKGDSVLPLFMAIELPPWLAGVVIAAVFAATISTLSANLSSASTAVVTDFIRRFNPAISGPRQIRCGQFCTYVVGVLGVVAALSLARIESHALFDNFNEFIAMLTAGLTGLFFMGVFLPRVKGKAAIAGLVANYAVCFGLKLAGCTIFGFRFHPFLLGGVGLVVCIAVALVLSVVFPEQGKDLSGLTLKTLKKAPDNK